MQVLRRREEGGFVEHLLERALARAELSPVDRHLCQGLVYGVVRWQPTLDWLIARKTDGRVQKPLVHELLRLGLCQIFWCERIPDHAAVHETVELARQHGATAQAGFVNALLRGYLREFAATRRLLEALKTTQPHLGFAHPAWLAQRWTARWGAEAAAQLMDWNNTPPKTFARVNTSKVESARLVARWREEGVECDVVHRDWLEENLVFELKSHPPLERLSSFADGWFYVQDPSTLLAVRELDPKPGQTMLDLCAAPGGKLTYAAQLMRGEGRLVAQDTSKERLKRLRENCLRLGIYWVEMAAPGGNPDSKRTHLDAAAGSLSPPERGEGWGEGNLVRTQRASSPQPSPPLGEEREKMVATRCGPARQTIEDTRTKPVTTAALMQPSMFDGVLIDAPCSNSGVMRRRVELRWRIRPEEIDRLRATQWELLRQSAPLAKPGGALVYSTCSLEPEENQEVVQEFLREAPEFSLESERQLLPFVDQVDGAYVARMRRRRS